MKVTRTLFVLLGLGAALTTACGGGGSAGAGGSTQFTLVEASNGFGRMLPYQIPIRDVNGNPTARVIEIDSIDDLQDNVTLLNPVLAPTEWPTGAILPDSSPGNHFIYVRFSQEVDITSVLNASTASADNNLTGAIKIVSVDPINGATQDIKGRAFVGGRTYGPNLDPNDPTQLALTTWVTRDQNTGDLVAVDIGGGQRPGLGFPGTEGGFVGDDVLVDPGTVVFVVDEQDLDLQVHDTFPTNLQIQMRVTESVRSTRGRTFETVALASSTVGPDTIPPAVLLASSQPVIVPQNNETDVDPETNIEITFTEPVQPLTLGELDDGTPPAIAGAVQISFGPNANRVQVPFSVRLFSVYDLSRVELVPLYNFPGSGPDIGPASCNNFDTVAVKVNPQQFEDLTRIKNSTGADTTFTSREAPGLVNAPVLPDAIYVARGSATPGISVIDLYGFGGGTGNPTFDPTRPIREGNSNYPNNPNVALQGNALIPPLSAGTCTFDGGSEGVFTLTKDSTLNDLVARRPLLESVGEMCAGHALDNTFNNAAPFGCQAGGGNICATTGLKRISLSAGGPNSLAPSTTSNLPVKVVSGMENLVIFAPHPNPPPISFPPLCLSPLINALEPTSVASSLIPNLLVPGSNAQGTPATNRPPSNLLATVQNSYFDGPMPPQATAQSCVVYVSRQQIGHFLYVIDRVASEIVVFNSNRFTVIDRIRTPDPTSMAMSPNMDLLAVTNEGADQVSFIDTDPGSASFHTVVRTEPVGSGPTGIAWEGGNEDILVCNQGDGTVSILSAFTLRTRKILRNQLTTPIDVVTTPRQLGFGFQRGIYFAYIMNQSGKLAFFESGPDGLNGWGFDDTIATLPFTFSQPKAMQPDITRLNSAVWVLHENPLDNAGNPTGFGGALTNVGIASATRGIIVIQPSAVNPQIRNMEFGVFASVGEGPGGLSGVPIDLAFDNMVNLTPLTNFSSQFSAGQPLSINGKSVVRFSGGAFVAASSPLYMFLAVPNPGVIDVLELSTGTVQRVDTNPFQPGFQSIPAINVTGVADFLRQ